MGNTSAPGFAIRGKLIGNMDGLIGQVCNCRYNVQECRPERVPSRPGGMGGAKGHNMNEITLPGSSGVPVPS